MADSQTFRHYLVMVSNRRQPVFEGEVRGDVERLLRREAEAVGCDVVSIEVRERWVLLRLDSPVDVAPRVVFTRLRRGTSNELLRTPELAGRKSVWSKQFLMTASKPSDRRIERFIEAYVPTRWPSRREAGEE